jgi:hypothetical protein
MSSVIRPFPAVLDAHEAGFDELDIPTTKRGEPSVAAIEAMLSQPAYWAGAAETRRRIGDTGRRFLLCRQIGDALAAGAALADIAAYTEWKTGAVQ